ncbi:twin-arginine translocation pathway signal [Neptuniibacter sp. QD29_5]|uniref:twin-arginine translocation pathway signal n=1 Tax=unclassified Neptuniibacter TaxID=2630693 RepID=UPI0039F561F4
MSQQEKPNTGRRGFLKKLGLAGTAAGAVAVAGTAQAKVTTAESGEKQEGSGYKETEHVRSFYETCRN